MTNISSPTTPSFATTQTQTEAAQSDTVAGIGAEFDSFIRLLTAQVQNQDPLSPLDSTQFVEQLATFSALEQQVQTNTHLQSIADLVRSLNGATDGA